MATRVCTFGALVIGLMFLWVAVALAVEPVYFEPVEIPENPDTAVTRSHIPDELTPMYYEPSSDARLLGEYFDGVSVNIIERISDEWVFIDIHTYGAGGYGYMMVQDLVIDTETEQVAKTTELYNANVDLLLSTHAMGQSGDMGPYAAGVQVELLGFSVSEESGVERPLSIEKAGWHVKIGDETGYLIYRDEGDLTKASQ